jgi:sugar O-acyltransferase (sialic acid O-acetyltransferase NeuD family)
MVLIGYSGHAYVAAGILKAAGKPALFYCDKEEKINNPFDLSYLGNETSSEAVEKIKQYGFFIAIGDNLVRKKIYDQFASLNLYPTAIIHPNAIVDDFTKVGKGVMVCAGVCINPLAKIEEGSICNTGCIIEHECTVASFAHIGPGAVLCGNVKVGTCSFVGAGSVIRQGISIGKNVTIGAGAVVVKNIEDGEIVVGNPSQKLIKV